MGSSLAMRRLFLIGCLCALVACSPVLDPRDADDATHRETMRHVAMTYGAQSGLAWKSEKINQAMEAHAAELDRVYNFNALMLKNNMLPPVIEEAQYTMNAEGHDTMRMADREIHMLRPAQLVTAPPTWRDYLLQSYAAPEMPDEMLYPKTLAERGVWKLGFEQGWRQGVKQADDIFAQSLGMINRDFNGMVLYHSLLAQNMVTPAYTSKAQLGITGDEKIMRVNDQILRITETAKLNPSRSDAWQAVVDIHEH